VGKRNSVSFDQQDPGQPRFSFSGRVQELVEGYNSVVQLLAPKWPWFLYPGYLTYAVYWRYAKYYKGKLQLTPIPNRLYDLLIKNELINSEHLVFASREVYDTYAESPDVNFVNLVIRGGRARISKEQNGDGGSTTRSVIKQMLQEAPHTIVAQILPVAQCQPNCLYVQVGNSHNYCEGKLHIV